MAPADGEHRPDARPQGRRARREAERAGTPQAIQQPTDQPTDRPSPYGSTPAEGISAPDWAIGPRSVSPYAEVTGASPYAAESLPGGQALPGGEAPDTTDGTAPGGEAAPLSRRARRDREHAAAAPAVPASGGRRPRGNAPRGNAPQGRRPGTVGRLTLRGRRLGTGTKVVAVAATAGITLSAAVAVATSSQAGGPLTRDRFAPTGTWAWYNDLPLGRTDESDQYAQAKVTGLQDADHNAGFFLRYGDRHDRVRVAVSGVGWRIEPTGLSPITGTFPHGSSGVFRAEAQGQTVRVLWNNQQVTQQTLKKSYGGRSVVATVWQSSPTVTMTALEASSLDQDTRAVATATLSPSAAVTTRSSGASAAPSSPSPSASSPSPTSASPSPSTSAPSRASGRRGWYSGASGDNLANGGFDRWRSSPAGIAGTWDDGGLDIQQELYSICGGQYSEGRWDRPLDLAMGGIYLKNGDSWSAAASGAYNDRWRQVLTKAKQCWGKRDPHKLFLRFAHEMNLSSSDWKVEAGQEGDFARAFTQLSNVRYQVFPGVQLVLSVNDGSSGGMADVRKLVPGPDGQGRPTVDVYGADSYNMWPHCTSASSCEEKFNESAGNGAPLGIEKHRQFAESKGLPFSVNEYSNNGDSGDADGGGESPAFVQSFYQWAKAHAGDPENPKPGQFLYDVLFNMWKQYELQPSTLQPQTADAYRRLPWGQA